MKESKKPFIATKYQIVDNNNNILKNYYGTNDLLKINKSSKPPREENPENKNNQPKNIEHRPITRSMRNNS